MITSQHNLMTLALTLGLLPAAVANADRTIWTGVDGNGTRTIFSRNADGTWREAVTGVGVSASYSFVEVDNTETFIQLFDSSRQMWVALFADRMEVFDQAAGATSWLHLYTGNWVENPAPRTLPIPPQISPDAARTLQIRLAEILILDDKEGGDGDWKVVASFGSHRNETLLDKLTGGSGERYAPRTATYDVIGPVTFTAQVFEFDDEVFTGSTWEYVGQKEVTISMPGDYTLDFDNDEGRVRLTIQVR